MMPPKTIYYQLIFFHAMCYNVKGVAREWMTRSASLVHHHEKPVEEMYKTLILVPVSMQEYVDPGVSIFFVEVQHHVVPKGNQHQRDRPL